MRCFPPTVIHGFPLIATSNCCVVVSQALIYIGKVTHMPSSSIVLKLPSRAALCLGPLGYAVGNTLLCE